MRLRVSGDSGTGPGPITADGCSVELYELLPAWNEPRIVHDAVPPAASILDLGAGTGRLTQPLLELGHHVVAVDDSPDMLARVRGAETVRSAIETLSLERSFDAVLLASQLINCPDEQQRRRFLRVCRAHVRREGCVLIQQHPPEWFDDVAPFRRERDGIAFVLRDIQRPEADVLSATVEYHARQRTWTQSFRTRRLDDVELAAALADADLELDRYLTADKIWIRAIPARHGSGDGTERSEASPHTRATSK